MKNFKELLIWQKSINLVIFIYKITKKFPDEEKYGLINQMKRSSVSIPSNIAERKTNKDFCQFLSIARGSCAELETQSIIAYKLNYLDEDLYKELNSKIEEIAKMLSSFYSKLNQTAKLPTS